MVRPLHPCFRELVYLSATAPDNIERLAHRADGAAYPAVRLEIVTETNVAIPAAESKILDWFSEIVGSILDKMVSAKARIPRTRHPAGFAAAEAGFRGVVGWKSRMCSGGGKVSGPCPTLDILLELGFEDRPPATQISPSISWMVPEHVRSPLVTVCYRFADFDLVASPLTKMFGREVVQLSGVIESSRSLTEIRGEIPPDLGSSVEAAAWVSFALKSHQSDLKPLPDWFVEGERNWDVVYARMDPKGWKRQQAYRDCPKCFIDREYARPLRRNLQEEFSWLSDETEMTFSFDGRVLSIVLNERAHEVIASGDSWPSSYRAVVSQETKFPTRFQSRRVEVSVFEGFVGFDRVRLGPCESVT